MTMMKKIFVGGAGLAALAAAAPSAAQYGYANPYGYGNQYGYANAYGYNSNMTTMAAQQCSAAVQNRLSQRTGLGGIVGALLGANTSSGRVLSITQVTPRGSSVRVRGLATSGRYAGYGAYGSAPMARPAIRTSPTCRSGVTSITTATSATSTSTADNRRPNEQGKRRVTPGASFVSARATARLRARRGRACRAAARRSA